MGIRRLLHLQFLHWFRLVMIQLVDLIKGETLFFGSYQSNNPSLYFLVV